MHFLNCCYEATVPADWSISYYVIVVDYVCPVGYNKSEFFKRKLETKTLWKVQNLNLKHIYLLRFLIFGAFFAPLASKFEKVLIWP